MVRYFNCLLLNVSVNFSSPLLALIFTQCTGISQTLIVKGKNRRSLSVMCCKWHVSSKDFHAELKGVHIFWVNNIKYLGSIFQFGLAVPLGTIYA